MPTRLVLLLLLAFSTYIGLGSAAWAEQEPRLAAVRLTPELASSLRDQSRLAEIERVLGGPGTRIGASEESDGPHVVDAWRDEAGGLLRAFRFQSGDFSLVMRPAGASDDIVMNSFGAFVCAACSPPVNACGRRPWWVPHDVHWDNFDCGCTLAGPQSVRVGHC